MFLWLSCLFETCFLVGPQRACGNNVPEFLPVDNRLRPLYLEVSLAGPAPLCSRPWCLDVPLGLLAGSAHVGESDDNLIFLEVTSTFFA